MDLNLQPSFPQFEADTELRVRSSWNITRNVSDFSVKWKIERDVFFGIYTPLACSMLDRNSPNWWVEVLKLCHDLKFPLFAFILIINIFYIAAHKYTMYRKYMIQPNKKIYNARGIYLRSYFSICVVHIHNFCESSIIVWESSRLVRERMVFVNRSRPLLPLVAYLTT